MKVPFYYVLIAAIIGLAVIYIAATEPAVTGNFMCLFLDSGSYCIRP